MKKNFKLLLAALTALGMVGAASACSFGGTGSTGDNSQSESPAVQYTVTFVADGETVETVTYEEGATEDAEAKYRSLYIKQGVNVGAGKTYKIRVYERSNFWVAVEEIN